MAQRVGEPWLTVGKLIELFTAMGCTLGEVPGGLQGPAGWRPLRYLHSPVTDDFVSLSDLEDGERLPPSEVANWERRLGISIPKGNNR